MKCRLLILFSMVLAAGMCSAAFADTVLFYDNFDSENGGVGVLNYSGFSNWSISDGTVDLIGNGFFDFFPQNGLYVDLDGSTGDAGSMVSKTFNLQPGEYTFSYDLAGSHRESRESVTITGLESGSMLFSQFYSLGPNNPFQTQNATIFVSQVGAYQLSFQNAGGDNIGALLDNVRLTRIGADPAPVPEPTSLLLLGSGLGIIGIARWRRK